MKLRTALTASALALAVSTPVSIAQASEGPYERGGKNVFEIKRDAKMKKAMSATKTETQATSTKAGVAKATKKKGWFKRLFKSAGSAS